MITAIGIMALCSGCLFLGKAWKTYDPVTIWMGVFLFVWGPLISIIEVLT